MSNAVYWFERVVRTDRSFGLVRVGSDGSRRVDGFSMVSRKAHLLPYRVSLFHKLSIDLADLEPVSHRAYLERIGFTQEVADGQAVYQLRSGERVFLIPASLLLRALVLILASLVDIILRPGAREHAWRVIERDGELGIQHAGGRLIPWYSRHARTAIERMIWLSCFPSARRLWDSVYVHASNGRLDLALPEARVEATLAGVKQGDCVLATNLTVFRLTPLDRPTLFATRLRRKTFTLHNPMWGNRAPLESSPNPAHRDTALTQGPSGWRLTDEEWEVARLAAKPRRITWRGRFVIDGIIEKLGTGQSWALFRTQYLMYVTMREDGSWERVRTALLQVRPPACTKKSGILN